MAGMVRLDGRDSVDVVADVGFPCSVYRAPESVDVEGIPMLIGVF